jgi:DNA invertase Pin-like site-specific DNA recombinase
MAAVSRGKIDTIICWKADRLARNAADAGAVLFALESKRLRQVITSDGTYSADADSELMLGILLGFSAKYSKDLSKNILRGMEEKLRRGVWPWAAPFGYRNVRSGDRATIEVDHAMAPYVRQLFELAASGAYSIDALARITKDTWKVRKPQRRTITTTLGLSHTTISHILRNPFYWGLLVRKGESYPGTHEPLITKQLYDRVQEVLRRRKRSTDRPQHRVFTFGGLVRCGACGRTLSGTITKSKSGRPYTYYVCSNKIRRRCTQPLLSEHALLTQVQAFLTRVAVTQDEYALIERILADAEYRGRDELARQRQDASTTLSAIEASARRLLDLLISGAITEDDYGHKKRELAARRAEATLTIANADTVLANGFQMARQFAAWLLEADDTFAKMVNEERRRFLHSIGFKMMAAGRKARLELAEPMSLIAEAISPTMFGVCGPESQSSFSEMTTHRRVLPQWKRSRGTRTGTNTRLLTPGARLPFTARTCRTGSHLVRPPRKIS